MNRSDVYMSTEAKDPLDASAVGELVDTGKTLKALKDSDARLVLLTVEEFAIFVVLVALVRTGVVSIDQLVSLVKGICGWIESNPAATTILCGAVTKIGHAITRRRAKA